MRRASTFVYHGLVNSQVPNQAKLESRKKFSLTQNNVSSGNKSSYFAVYVLQKHNNERLIVKT